MVRIFFMILLEPLIFICMKEKIIQLKNEGKSYREIEKILGCSKGTISYHCGKGQKEKTELRKRKYLKTLNGILKRKKDNFSFIKGNRDCPGKRVGLEFSSKEFKNKLVSNSICYLTGRKIDLWRPNTYQCDHIIPVSKGGKSELGNLGLTCKEANLAKSDMVLDEFILLCKEVLIHNGYSVEKKI